MNRDKFLTCLRENNISLDLAAELLTDYCVVEHNKDVKLTMIFINMVMATNQLTLYIQDVIEYYKRKFIICTVTRLRDNQILYMY
mgnify:FL=1